MAGKRTIWLAALSLCLVVILPVVAVSGPGPAPRWWAQVAGIWSAVRGAPPAVGSRLTVLVVDPVTDQTIASDTNGRVISNRPFSSLEFIASLINGEIRWDGKDRTAIIVADGLRTTVAGGLGYGLSLSTEPEGYAVFTVTNRSGSAKRLTFPSGKSYELVLKCNGREIWRSSEDTAYSAARRTLDLPTGDSLTYIIDLPSLTAGIYRAEAWFEGDRSSGPAVSHEFAVGRQAESRPWELLEYQLTVRTETTGDLTGEFIVMNTTDRPVSFSLPTTMISDFAIRSAATGRIIWRQSDDLDFLSRVTVDEIAARSRRRMIAALPVLARGSYQLEAYFWNFHDPMSTASFTIR